VGITAQQLQQIEARLNRSRAPARLASGAALQCGPVVWHEVIVGIDPSLRGTGYGVLRLGRPGLTVLAQGTIRCPASWQRSKCLAHIARTIRAIVRQHRPTACVIEALFYAQNLQTALVLGEARGASLAAAAEAGLAIYEIASRRVKQAIVGYGGAHKPAVAKMVQHLLHLAETPEPDAADALALALAFAHEQARFGLSPLKPV